MFPKRRFTQKKARKQKLKEDHIIILFLIIVLGERVILLGEM